MRSGDGSKLALPLSLQNLGNLLIQKDQLVSVRLFAVADGSETETEIEVGPLAAREVPDRGTLLALALVRDDEPAVTRQRRPARREQGHAVVDLRGDRRAGPRVDVMRAPGAIILVLVGIIAAASPASIVVAVNVIATRTAYDEVLCHSGAVPGASCWLGALPALGLSVALCSNTTGAALSGPGVRLLERLASRL